MKGGKAAGRVTVPAIVKAFTIAIPGVLIVKLQRLVGNYISEPFHHVTNWVVKGFGVVYRQYRIDYAFEPEEWVDANEYVDFGPYAQSHLEKIKWKDHTILVPTLALHIKSNVERGRTETVDKIKAAIL